MRQKNNKEKTKAKNAEHLSPDMVKKIREIRPKKWRLCWEGLMEQVSFESGVEQRCIVKVEMMMMMMTNW